jgi:hypothetical protein
LWKRAYVSRGNRIEDGSDHHWEMEPDYEPLPDQVGTGDGAKAVLAVGGALLAGAGAGPGVPVAVALLQLWREKFQKHQEKRREDLVKAASQESSMDPEEAVRRIADDDRLTFLALEALEAASRTRLDSKAAALGRSLGKILQDDARIDKESIWIRILSVIEPPHMRVLQYFVVGRKLRAGGTYWTPKGDVSVRTVSEGLELEDAVLLLIQDLLRCGLLMNPGHVDGGKPDTVFTPDSLSENLRATQLGAELFKRLELAAEET